MKKHPLTKTTTRIRRQVLEMIYTAKTSHIGTCFSCVDILTALYFGVMQVDPGNPLSEKRDRFILSKGHGCAALYATLAQRGFFATSCLDDYSLDGSALAGHATRGVLPGIEASAGSEGHGLPMGIGMAIAIKKLPTVNRLPSVFVLLGDGECNEGSVWEAVMFAGFHRIRNLIAIVDKNGLQIMGKTSDIIDLDPLGKKFRDFGWETAIVDGHNLSALQKALTMPHNKPLVVIAKTVKGKGVSFMEHQAEWHGKFPNETQYRLAVEELS